MLRRYRDRLARLFAAIAMGVASSDALRADTISVAGTPRTYIAALAPDKLAPLVIVLHGNTGQGSDLVKSTTWQTLGKQHHFSVLFPDGLNKAWADARSASERSGYVAPTGTDDVGFLAALISKYVAEGIADPRRVYVAGVSNGGAMAITVACEHPELIAAVASVIMTMTDSLEQTCRNVRPMPIVFMNGTKDPLIPFEGGRGTSRYAAGGYWATPKSIQYWRAKNNCDAADQNRRPVPHRDRNGTTTAVEVTSRCPGGQDVLLLQIDGGGHRVPRNGSETLRGRIGTLLLGEQNRDIDSSEVIWQFFQRATTK